MFLTQVGDRVTVGGSQVGTVRFAGITKFAPGYVWCHVMSIVMSLLLQTVSGGGAGPTTRQE